MKAAFQTGPQTNPTAPGIATKQQENLHNDALHGYVRAVKISTANMAYRYTSNEAKPSEISWSPQRTKDTFLQKSGITYTFKCTRTDSKEEYIGSCGRTFG